MFFFLVQFTVDEALGIVNENEVSDKFSCKNISQRDIIKIKNPRFSKKNKLDADEYFEALVLGVSHQRPVLRDLLESMQKQNKIWYMDENVPRGKNQRGKITKELESASESEFEPSDDDSKQINIVTSDGDSDASEQTAVTKTKKIVQRRSKVNNKSKHTRSSTEVEENESESEPWKYSQQKNKKVKQNTSDIQDKTSLRIIELQSQQVQCHSKARASFEEDSDEDDVKILKGKIKDLRQTVKQLQEEKDVLYGIVKAGDLLKISKSLYNKLKTDCSATPVMSSPPPSKRGSLFERSSPIFIPDKSNSRSSSPSCSSSFTSVDVDTNYCKDTVDEVLVTSHTSDHLLYTSTSNNVVEIFPKTSIYANAEKFKDIEAMITHKSPTTIFKNIMMNVYTLEALSTCSATGANCGSGPKRPGLYGPAFSAIFAATKAIVEKAGIPMEPTKKIIHAVGTKLSAIRDSRKIVSKLSLETPPQLDA